MGFIIYYSISFESGKWIRKSVQCLRFNSVLNTT